MCHLAARWTLTIAGLYSLTDSVGRADETYAPQFSPTTGAPVKSMRLALGALVIKQRISLTDEETVEQIRVNA